MYSSMSEIGLEAIVLLGSDGLFRCGYSVISMGGEDSRRTIDIDPARHRELIGQFERLELEAYLTSRGPYDLSANHLISVDHSEGNRTKTDYRYEVPKYDTPAPMAGWLEALRLCAGQENK